ncbi:MAG: sugar phosphate isomerase/epimerase [Pirellulaceae bacterium]|nr:sugar phosphate isomerase/epimerase [Pirellulaceae bacterium]
MKSSPVDRSHLESRRQWLSNTMAVLGLAACPSILRARSAALPTMKFGLVTYLWGQHMTLPELLKACETSGLLGVELRTEHKHAVEPSLSPAQRAEVKRRFADSPVELVGYGSNCEFHADDPAKVASNIQQAKQYIQLMHDCGGSGVKVKPNGFARQLSREQTIEQIGRALNEIAEYGQQYGQQIRVEVHGRGTSELPVMADIFAVADHPNVAVCWNSNGEDLHGAGLEANFNLIKGRLGATTHVRELDDPSYPYEQLLKLFKQANYQGWILLEARTDPADKTAAMTQQREIFEKLCAS